MMGFVEGKCLQTVVGIVHGLELSHGHPSAASSDLCWSGITTMESLLFGRGASFHGLLRGLE